MSQTARRTTSATTAETLRSYGDLAAAFLVTALAALVVAALPEWQSPLRVGLGLIVILAAPGYVVASVAFPRHDDIDGIERLAVTLGMSIAAVPLLGLILNWTPWGIRPVPMGIALTLFVALFAGIAGAQRATLPRQQAFRVPWGTPPFWQGSGLAAFTMAVLLGVPALAVALRPSDAMTEFYLLGAEGELQDYPRALAPGEPFEITIGVTNREEREMSYQVAMPFDPANRRVVTPVLQDGEAWERTLTLRAPTGAPTDDGGRTKLPFDLYLDEQAQPYRQVHIFVDLVEPRERGFDAGAEGPPPAGPPPTDAPLPPAGTPVQLHVVQPGETLYGLARRYLGDGNRYLELFEVNRDVLDDPRVVPPGTTLRIPVEAP